YNMGNPKSPEEPNAENFMSWLEKAATNDCVEAKVLWAEYLAFGEIWTKNDDHHPAGLLYKKEESKKFPNTATKMLTNALIELQNKNDKMHEYRTEKFIRKTEYLLNQLNKQA
ncbi:MAG: hypothetical protein ACI4UK_12530, partial [Floccifex sp.]